MKGSYDIADISKNLSDKQKRYLLLCHSFTGCDTVSSFAGKGKTSCLLTWESFLEITNTFVLLGNHPNDHVIEGELTKTEKFVRQLYDKSTNETLVNQCRRQLFTKKSRSLELIPPTKAALKQHARRAVFQAGFVWKLALEKSPSIPSQINFGWFEDGKTPKWSEHSD